MPVSAPRPCTHPGCPALTRSGPCDAHRIQRSRQYDRQRGSTSSRGYGSNWRKIRRAKLSADPLCERCLEAGRTTAGKVVHHINGQPFDNHAENHQTLCKSCHNAAHPEKATALSEFGR